MCEYCESKKNLLRYPKNIDCSEVLIEDKKLSLAIADGTKICDKPVRHCYKIAIEYCPKCGRKL